MPTTIYDSSQITTRKGQKATSGVFLTRMYPPNPATQPQPGSAPLLGIYDNSIMNAVKTGSMTQYTRYDACYGISPGCPCPELNASLSKTPYVPAIPGPVTGITFMVGSIVVSWQAPTTGDGPFTYAVTPYLNGVAKPVVYTTNTSYKFTNLEEWEPYTFTVCAMNAGGQGPIVPSSGYFMAPPDGLSTIMSGSSTPVVPEPSLKYVINAGLNSIIKHVVAVNLGPTRGSRFAYLWVASVAQAWNWVRPVSEQRISGVHDNWNWTSDRAISHLSNNDSIVWICSVIDQITPTFVPSYKSIYTCPADVVARVKAAGQWDNWFAKWQAWYNWRQTDGIDTATRQPSQADDPNFAETIVVNGTTVTDINAFPAPQKWTRLTVTGTKRNYMTYYWNQITSTCLTPADEQAIQNNSLVGQPATGVARDAEVDEVKNMAATLTDRQKIIAEFWAGGPGTMSPPLMFIWLWKEYMRTYNMTCPNIMFSLLDLAIHLFEGARVTWKLKAAYMEDRPIQEIRRRYGGQTILSWNGLIDGAQWVPYQEANFITPPFADFPSGHSHFSKAFALTMTAWFGPRIDNNQTFFDLLPLMSPLFKQSQSGTYGIFTIPTGTSTIQTGVPFTQQTLAFDEWDDMSEQSGISRLYGGIHCETANRGSKEAAILVDNYIKSTWSIRKN